VGSLTFSAEKTQTITDSLKDITDPTPAHPLKGRGVAAHKLINCYIVASKKQQNSWKFQEKVVYLQHHL
jgi:hypothetical protein